MPGTRSIELVSFMFRLACHDYTHCDDLEADQAGDVENIAPGDTEEEGNGVEDVADDQFDSEVVVAVKTNVASPPGQKARNKVQ